MLSAVPRTGHSHGLQVSHCRALLSSLPSSSSSPATRILALICSFPKNFWRSKVSAKRWKQRQLSLSCKFGDGDGFGSCIGISISWSDAVQLPLLVVWLRDRHRHPSRHYHLRTLRRQVRLLLRIQSSLVATRLAR